MRRFVAERIAPVAREWEQSGRYPTEIVEGLKELGLFGMIVPEAYGGLGLDAVSYGIVFEEISKAWMGIAGILGSHSLATNLIAQSGTEEQKRRYLPELATGERRSGIGLTEPGAGSDLQGIATTARREVTSTSSTARRPGSPTPAMPTRCRSWSRPIRALTRGTVA